MARHLILSLLLSVCASGVLCAEELRVRKYPVHLAATKKKLGKPGRHQILITLTIAKGVHIYSGRVKSDLLRPAAVQL